MFSNLLKNHQLYLKPISFVLKYINPFSVKIKIYKYNSENQCDRLKIFMDYVFFYFFIFRNNK